MSHPATNSADDQRARRAAGRVSELVRAGVAQRQILASLTSVAEAIAGSGAVCSILLLDRDGLLRNGASPNLPADYLDAIDRLKPDANVGTCSVAAATGNLVITPDFCADDKWAELRHLPLSLGFVGAWSMPIKSASGAVLGTFGTYFRDRREPTAREVESVRILAEAAALAVV